MVSCRTLCAVLLVLVSSWIPARGALREHGVSREEILARLVEADRTLEGWDVPRTRAALRQLADDLAGLPGPFFQAVHRRIGEIVGALDAGRMRDADRMLEELVVQVRDGVPPQERAPEAPDRTQ